MPNDEEKKTTYTMQEILQMPQFYALSLSAKNQVLRAYPQFKSLSPQGQMKVLEAYHYSAPPSPQGFWSSVGDVLAGQGKALVGQAVRPWQQVKEGYQQAGIPGAVVKGLGTAVDPIGQLQGMIGASQDTLKNYDARREAGYGKTYSALAPTGAALTGVNLPSMEEAARTGQSRKVLAEAAVPAAEVALGEAGSQIAKIPAVAKRIPGNVAYMDRMGPKEVGDALNVPTSEEAQAMATRRGVPDRLAAAKDVAIAQKDLGEIERSTPVKGKGSSSVFARAKNTLDYAKKLWQEGHAASIKRYAQAPTNSQALVTAGQKVITRAMGEASARAPGEVERASEWLQTQVAKPRNLGELDSFLREINADLETPSAKQSYGPALARVQAAVAKAVRAEIDNTLIRYGETGVRAINSRYGALNNLAERMIVRGLSELAAEGRAGAVPDWMHVYTFVHPSAEGLLAAVGASGRLNKMFRPTASSDLAAGMSKLARSQPAPPAITTPPRWSAPALPERSSAFREDPLKMSREMRLGQATRPEKMIQEAGGEFVGFRPGPRERFVIFRDPKTGKYMHLRESLVSPAAVSRAMNEARNAPKE